MSLSHHSQRRGYVVAVFSALVFSTTALFIRQLTAGYHMPSLVLAAWRSASVAFVLFPVLAVLSPRRLRLRPGDLRFFVAQGVSLAGFNVIWTLSVARCGASIATALVFTSGAFTALFGSWSLGERVGRAGWTAIAVCLTGTAMVSGVFSAGTFRGDVLGVVAGLLSGAGYAAYSVLGRAGAQRGIDSWVAVLYPFSIGALVQLGALGVLSWLAPGVVSLSDLFCLGHSLGGWATLVGLAVPTLLGYGLYNIALGIMPAGKVNLIVTLEPAFTAVAAWSLLGERLGAMELVGGLVIMSGVAVLRVGDLTPSALASPEGPASSATHDRAA